MRPMILKNDLVSQSGDILFEFNGELLSLPRHTFDALRRKLGLQPLTGNAKPRRNSGQFTMTETRKEILDVVEKSKRPICAVEIAQIIGNENIAAVGATLSDLFKGGKVRREKRKNLLSAKIVFHYFVDLPDNTISLPLHATG
jgi:DNA-binding transcriptional ArsR family regulator